jgi:1-acyl-sn-glycerol-3-phosphate acyltransferase
MLWPIYRIRAFGPGVGQMPVRGPLLIVANHSSYLDPIWIGKVAPQVIHPMMTSVFYDVPYLRWWLAHVFRVIRVEAAFMRREAPELAEAVVMLKQGECVVIFPEGQLRKTDGELLRQFGQGVWHILREVPKTPVVVLWIEGGWGSFCSYKNGPPTKNKRFDWWRHIDIGVSEVRPLPAAILVDHRTTRDYLRQTCLECRRYLGLPLPSDTKEKKDEEARPDTPAIPT